MYLSAVGEFIKNNMILLCVAILSALLLVFFIVTAVIKNGRYNRQRDLIRYRKKFDELHHDLSVTCNNYLKRLNVTSATNLYHASLYQELLPDYNVIVKTFEPAIEEELKRYKANIDEDGKTFKKYRDDLKNIFKVYKDKVEKMTNTLKSHFATEESLRRQLKDLNKQYDLCREEFVANEETLDILSDTFFRIFDFIEEQIEETKHSLDSTDYEKGEECINTINEALKELRNGLQTLPSLCIDINETIPNLIDEVETEYEKMKEDNIPVHHLHVTSSLASYRTALTDLVHNMSNFEYSKCRAYLDQIVKEINELRQCFKNEYDSAELVDSDCDSVYEMCSDIEKSFIALRQKIVQIVKYYRIAPSYDGYVDKIQLRINELSNIKRQLDTYVHSSTKQPYSILVGKMNELSNECNEVSSMISEFNNYIDSLKVDCDKSFGLVNETYLAVKHSEYLLRELNVNSVIEPLKETVDHIYSLLDRLNNVLVCTPIDVGSVNRYSNELTTLKTAFVETVKNYIDQASLAEKDIVIANRVRPSVNTFKSILDDCEKDFFKGEFEKANESALAVIQKVKARG